MRPDANIVLTGFMGTGKTSAGRALARRLGRPFVDLDDRIVEKAGKPIPEIFAQDGEPAFRRIEREVVRETAATSGWVVAAGGGVVVNRENVDDLVRSGLVVCLTAPPEVILHRVGRETHRPLLEGVPDKLARIAELLEKRRPLYAAVPHHVDTTGHSPEDTAAAVEKLFRSLVDGA